MSMWFATMRQSSHLNSGKSCKVADVPLLSLGYTINLDDTASELHDSYYFPLSGFPVAIWLQGRVFMYPLDDDCAEDVGVRLWLLPVVADDLLEGHLYRAHQSEPGQKGAQLI